MKKLLFVFLGFVTLSIFVTTIFAEDVVVAEGKRVKFEYNLKVDGKLIESTSEAESLEYIHGQGQIIPGLASALTGMKVGEEKIVVVEPKDGYGDVVQEAIQAFPKEVFGGDADLAKGMVVELDTPDQGKVPAVVWEVKEEEVVLNFNHPLAGKTLEFDVKVVEVE